MRGAVHSSYSPRPSPCDNVGWVRTRAPTHAPLSTDLLIVRPEEDARREVVVVLNWVAELRQPATP